MWAKISIISLFVPVTFVNIHFDLPSFEAISTVIRCDESVDYSPIIEMILIVFIPTFPHTDSIRDY